MRETMREREMGVREKETEGSRKIGKGINSLRKSPASEKNSKGSIHPSPGSLMGKICLAPVPVQPSPVSQSAQVRLLGLQAKASRGQVQSATPRVLLGRHARNAMQDSDSVGEPRS